MELDDLNEGGPPKRVFTCPQCGDKNESVGCINCGEGTTIREILDEHAPPDLSSHNIAALIYDKERLASELSRAKDELRVAKDMYEELYIKTQSSPSVYSGGFGGLVEPKYIDAIWRSCLSHDKKIEVVEKLKRIAANNEAGFKETEHDNYGGSELPFCNFCWAMTKEEEDGDLYWEGIYVKINSQPLSDSPSKVPARAGETFTNVSTGVTSMASAVFNITIIGVSTSPLGQIDERVIETVSGILAPDSSTAAFLAGTRMTKELKLEKGEKIVIRNQNY